VACGLPDVLPASALQKADKLLTGKDGKALGHTRRLCAGLEITWDAHLDRHDGRNNLYFVQLRYAAKSLV
jgi:hypothetical protein